jgi:transcriptional regulator of acetoin/glycerol metabolism
VVHLAPLEQRRADLLDLADVVWPLGEGRRTQPWSARLTVEAAEALVLHRWPDNLRSLRSALSRAQALAGDEPVSLARLPADVLAKVAVARPDAKWTPTEARRPPPGHLRDALRRHGGRIDRVAQEFGVHRRQVYRWLAYAGVSDAELAAFRSD